MEGKKEVLGLWSTDNEGAKFWLQVLTEIQYRPDAAPFPPTTDRVLILTSNPRQDKAPKPLFLICNQASANPHHPLNW